MCIDLVSSIWFQSVSEWMSKWVSPIKMFGKIWLYLTGSDFLMLPWRLDD